MMVVVGLLDDGGGGFVGGWSGSCRTMLAVYAEFKT